MNPFKRTGFDSIIAAGVLIKGDLEITSGCTIIDGSVHGSIRCIAYDKKTNAELVVAGDAGTLDSFIFVPCLTITGHVECDSIVVETLSIKSGAFLRAKTITYSKLNIENGAQVLGQMIFKQPEE